MSSPSSTVQPISKQRCQRSLSAQDIAEAFISSRLEFWETRLSNPWGDREQRCRAFFFPEEKSLGKDICLKMKAKWLVLRQLRRRMAHRFFHIHKTYSWTSIALASTDLNTAAFIYANGEISTSNEDSTTTVHQNLYPCLGGLPAAWKKRHYADKACIR